MKTEQEQLDAVAKKWVAAQKCPYVSRPVTDIVDHLPTTELMALQIRIKELIKDRNTIALKRLGRAGGDKPIKHLGQEGVSYESPQGHASRMAHITVRSYLANPGKPC